MSLLICVTKVKPVALKNASVIFLLVVTLPMSPKRSDSTPSKPSMIPLKALSDLFWGILGNIVLALAVKALTEAFIDPIKACLGLILVNIINGSDRACSAANGRVKIY